MEPAEIFEGPYDQTVLGRAEELLGLSASAPAPELAQAVARWKK
jgi:hypothetical protein